MFQEFILINYVTLSKVLKYYIKRAGSDSDFEERLRLKLPVLNRVSLTHESYLTHTWVMSHSHTWVVSHSYVSHVSLTCESCLTQTHESCLTHTWVMSHSHMSHVSLTHTSHVSLTHESCLTHTWVMSHSHTWVMPHWHMRHVSLTYESCLTHTSWVMSHASECHTYEWRSHAPISHTPFTCLRHPYCRNTTHIWDMTHPYMIHDSPIYGTCLVHMRDMTHSYVSGIRTVHNTTHIRDMTNPYMWHDSNIYGTCFVHMRNMTHSYVTGIRTVTIPPIYGTWIIRIWYTIHP